MTLPFFYENRTLLPTKREKQEQAAEPKVTSTAMKEFTVARVARVMNAAASHSMMTLAHAIAALDLGTSIPGEELLLRSWHFPLVTHPSEAYPKSLARSAVVAEHQLRRLEFEVVALRREVAELKAHQQREIAALQEPLAQFRELARNLRAVQGQLSDRADLPPSALPDTAELEKRFQLEDRGLVLTYVASRDGWSMLLIAAAQEIERRFGAGPVTLRMRDDRLIVVIGTSLEVDDAEARLTSFRREWWRPKVTVEDRTVLKLEYV